MSVTPVPRDALVSAVVPVRGERVRVVGVLLGRMQRVGGKPLAAEVEIIDDGYAGAHGRGRVTLVPAGDVEAANEYAKVMMSDAGPSPRA